MKRRQGTGPGDTGEHLRARCRAADRPPPPTWPSRPAAGACNQIESTTGKTCSKNDRKRMDQRLRACRGLQHPSGTRHFRARPLGRTRHRGAHQAPAGACRARHHPAELHPLDPAWGAAARRGDRGARPARCRHHLAGGTDRCRRPGNRPGAAGFAQELCGRRDADRVPAVSRRGLRRGCRHPGRGREDQHLQLDLPHARQPRDRDPQQGDLCRRDHQLLGPLDASYRPDLRHRLRRRYPQGQVGHRSVLAADSRILKDPRR